MVDSRLLKSWVLTGKEDNDVKIYSPKKALADTRQETEQDGFELKPNGELVKYELSPAGSPVRSVGKYKIDGNTLYTYFENHYQDSPYKIVELGDNVLKII